MSGNGEKITISDIAEALGISKTTVSRAISGKGRIGEDTVRRVQEYIKEHDYIPNPMAKGLASQRTYNIAWIMPGDSYITDLPFFQRCMIGVTGEASAHDYDVIISLSYDENNDSLERLLRNKKVDGIILGRTMIKDNRIEALLNADIPFVAIGSCNYEGVVQIDNDHVKACFELTDSLIKKGIRRIGLIGGTSDHVVNNDRLKGYMQALKENKLDKSCGIFMDCESVTSVRRAVNDLLKASCECIICMDDRICQQVLEYIKSLNMECPQDVKIASFYNSVLLDNIKPAVSAIKYDPKELGIEACRVLLKMIDGKEVNEKTLLDYEILLRGSTN